MDPALTAAPAVLPVSAPPGTAPPTVVRVRRARLADAEAVAVLHVSSWRAAYHGLVPQAHLDGLDARARAARWRAILTADGPGRTFVAVSAQGSLLGFVSCGPERDEDALERGVIDHAGPEQPARGEVYALYAAPSAWRTGVGTALMGAALEHLTGVPAVVLWVIEGNERALGFYRAQGFVPDGATLLDEIGGARVIEHRLLRPLP